MLFDWSAPPECPSAQTVAVQVEAIVGPELSRAPLVVAGHVERFETEERAGQSRYRLALSIRIPGDVDTQGANVRVLESRDCQKLGDAAALIVSLDLRSRTRPPADPPMAAREAEATGPCRYQNATSGGSKLHGGLGADVSGDVGTLPHLSWGGGMHGFVTYGSFRAELGGMFWPRTEGVASSPFGGGAHISLRAASLAGCYAWWRKSEISACLRFEGGGLRAVGYDIGRPGTSNGHWLAGFAGLALRPLAWPVSWNRLFPRLLVEVGTPIVYGDVVVERVGRVHTSSSVLFRFGLAVDVDLF